MLSTSLTGSPGASNYHPNPPKLKRYRDPSLLSESNSNSSTDSEQTLKLLPGQTRLKTQKSLTNYHADLITAHDSLIVTSAAKPPIPPTESKIDPPQPFIVYTHESPLRYGFPYMHPSVQQTTPGGTRTLTAPDGTRLKFNLSDEPIGSGAEHTFYAAVLTKADGEEQASVVTKGAMKCVVNSKVPTAVSEVFKLDDGTVYSSFKRGVTFKDATNFMVRSSANPLYKISFLAHYLSFVPRTVTPIHKTLHCHQDIKPDNIAIIGLNEATVIDVGDLAEIGGAHLRSTPAFSTPDRHKKPAHIGSDASGLALTLEYFIDTIAPAYKKPFSNLISDCTEKRSIRPSLPSIAARLQMILTIIRAKNPEKYDAALNQLQTEFFDEHPFLKRGAA